ncbi:phosphatase [Streptomyces carminius]|uniref:Phosphatase n=1 Tax=Streptomyces carminius TaxID=2665496 RepID=A0A2M8LRN9_9ACTN|nr:HAD family hydrolase [Streptomyces carminius]PJE94605.1 phosphatase [Streptomyces carminius]
MDPETRGAHIVWDWNGTLLHDIEAVVAATNASLAELGLPPLTLARYQELYCVPVTRFYERLMGRLPTAEEWAGMDEVFHRHYFDRVERVGLTEGAAELLAARRAAGLTQSLCSLARHEHLVPLVRRHGIEEHFVRVDGSADGNVRGKARQMAAHVAALGGFDPRRTVVVGDALDDAVAAARVGVRAVLYTGGAHSRAGLAVAGVPVVDTLAEAVEVAEELVAEG